MNIDNAIETWFSRLDGVTEKVKSEFGRLSNEQLNWKPSEEKWSIAEVLEHLNLVNASYEKILSNSANGTSDMGWTSNLGFFVTFMGNMIYRSVEPTRAKKITTFPIWVPAQSNIQSDVIEEFVQHQQALKKLIAESKPLLEKDITIPSPANRYVVYKLRKAVEIVVSHEERHLNQALEVKSLLNL